MPAGLRRAHEGRNTSGPNFPTHTGQLGRSPFDRRAMPPIPVCEQLRYRLLWDLWELLQHSSWSKWRSTFDGPRRSIYRRDRRGTSNAICADWWEGTSRNYCNVTAGDGHVLWFRIGRNLGILFTRKVRSRWEVLHVEHSCRATPTNITVQKVFGDSVAFNKPPTAS